MAMTLLCVMNRTQTFACISSFPVVHASDLLFSQDVFLSILHRLLVRKGFFFATSETLHIFLPPFWICDVGFPPPSRDDLGLPTFIPTLDSFYRPRCGPLKGESLRVSPPSLPLLRADRDGH